VSVAVGGGFSVDVVSVRVGGASVDVVSVVPVVSVSVGGGLRSRFRGGGGGGCVVVVGTVVTVIGGAAGGGCVVVVGITPPVGPPGMFAGGSAVPSANVPVVSVFVAVIGGAVSPGALIVDVALLFAPSCTTSYCG
jgi:hypothetical protein